MLLTMTPSKMDGAMKSRSPASDMDAYGWSCSCGEFSRLPYPSEELAIVSAKGHTATDGHPMPNGRTYTRILRFVGLYRVGVESSTLVSDAASKSAREQAGGNDRSVGSRFDGGEKGTVGPIPSSPASSRADAKSSVSPGPYHGVAIGETHSPSRGNLPGSQYEAGADSGSVPAKTVWVRPPLNGRDSPSQSAREIAGGTRGSSTPESLKEKERRVADGGILSASASNRADTNLSSRSAADATNPDSKPMGGFPVSASNGADFPDCGLCAPCAMCDDECSCFPGPCWWCGHSSPCPD